MPAETHPLAALHRAGPAGCPGGRWYGVFPALVSDVKDPDGQGRVQVSLPWAGDPGGDRYQAWARLATLMGGGNRGSWFIPDVDDEVLITFGAGDPRFPYVIGCLWNGRDAPPESMDGAGANHRKVLRSRNGVTILLDDRDGRERLVLETPGGQTVTLGDGPGSIEMTDASGNAVRLESGGVTISTAGRFTVTAASMELSAATVTVKTGTTRLSGMVKTDILVSNAVTSATYSPGAGNLQ